MRCACTGSHSTGKTRLSKLLCGKQKWRYLPEAPFQALQAGFPLNEKTSLATTVWIFAKQAEMENGEEPFVADKCFIDLLAYARYLLPGEGELLTVCEKIAAPYIARYDCVFYLPSGEFPIEDDGYRSLDPKFQLKIDEQIRVELQRLHVYYKTIIGSPDERYIKAMDTITAAELGFVKP